MSVSGEVVAKTERPRILFETGLPPRYDIPPEDVLLPSGKNTQCPYKGIASYHSVEAGGEIKDALVWYYPNPIPAAADIKDLLCFFNEKVDLEVDGEVQQRPTRSGRSEQLAFLWRGAYTGSCSVRAADASS